MRLQFSQSFPSIAVTWNQVSRLDYSFLCSSIPPVHEPWESLVCYLDVDDNTQWTTAEKLNAIWVPPLLITNHLVNHKLACLIPLSRIFPLLLLFLLFFLLFFFPPLLLLLLLFFFLSWFASSWPMEGATTHAARDPRNRICKWDWVRRGWRDVRTFFRVSLSFCSSFVYLAAFSSFSPVTWRVASMAWLLSTYFFVREWNCRASCSRGCLSRMDTATESHCPRAVRETLTWRSTYREFTVVRVSMDGHCVSFFHLLLNSRACRRNSNI